MAVPNLSGRVKGNEGGFVSVRSLLNSSDWKSKSLDAELRRERLKIEDSPPDDLGRSAFALEDLLELATGCFLVRRREALSWTSRSPLLWASSRASKRFSSSSLSASRRFVTRFSFLGVLWHVGDLQIAAWPATGVICVGVSSSTGPGAADRLEPGVPVEGKREFMGE
jgi:hypothetical protein